MVPLFGLLIGLAVSLAGAPAGVDVFGEERQVFFREAASGHNRYSYYAGKSISVLYRIILSALHFTAVLYFLGTPLIAFSRLYTIIVLTFYSVYAMAAIISMLVRRENAALMSVVCCMIYACFCGFGPSLNDASGWGVAFVWELSYGKWGTEALVSDEVFAYNGIYDMNSAAAFFGYTLNRYAFDIGMMVLIGSLLRVVALVLMILTHRDRQR